MKTVVTIVVLLIGVVANAQQYRWMTGGGSSDVLSNGKYQGEWITNMCVDDNDNVYYTAVIGDYNIRVDSFYRSQSKNASSSDAWTLLFASYDCEGNLRFAKLIEASKVCEATGLVYSGGKVYMSGMLFGTNKHIGDDAAPSRYYGGEFVLKYDTSGQYDWISFVGPDSQSTELGMWEQGALSVDGNGYIHYITTMKSGVRITPSITSQLGTYDLKYDVNGTLLSVTHLQSIDTEYVIEQVAIDKTTNNYYALFTIFSGTTTRSGTALVKYRPDGTMIWKDTTNIRAGFSSIELTDDGSLYFDGGGDYIYGGITVGGKTYNGSHFNKGSIAVVGKLSPQTGQTLWMYGLECSNSILGFDDITILPDGSIGALGNIGGTVIYDHLVSDTMQPIVAEGHNPLFVNIDSNGLLIEWHQLHGAGFYDNGRVLTSDKVGNVYVSGEVISDMRGDGAPKYTSGGGNSDYYLGRFGYSCDCTAPAFPVASFSYTVDTLTRTLQFSYTGGSTADSVEWGFGDGSGITLAQQGASHVYADTGHYTVCMKVHVPCGRSKVCMDVYVPPVSDVSVLSLSGIPDVQIYPNPVSSELNISGLRSGMELKLYDVTGRLQYSGVATGGTTTIDMSNLSSGIYLLQVSDGIGGRYTTRVVKR